MLCKLNFPKNIRCPKMTDGWKFHQYISQSGVLRVSFPIDDRRLPVFAYSGLDRSRCINLKYRWNFAGKICRGFFNFYFAFIETVRVENSLTDRYEPKSMCQNWRPLWNGPHRGSRYVYQYLIDFKECHRYPFCRGGAHNIILKAVWRARASVRNKVVLRRRRAISFSPAPTPARRTKNHLLAIRIQYNINTWRS